MRSCVVAVAGSKGSPGVSFVTAALALQLASAGLDTLVLDADAEDCGMGAILGVPGSGSKRSDPLEIAGRLRLLEADGGDGRELVAFARSRFQAVVADLGHQPAPLQKQLALAADWLLWVVSPDRQGLARADRLLGELPLVAGSGGLIFNRWRRGSPAGCQRSLADRHRLPLMGVLSDRPSLGRHPLLERQPHRDRVLCRPLRELARTLHPQAPEVSPAWP